MWVERSSPSAAAVSILPPRSLASASARLRNTRIQAGVARRVSAAVALSPCSASALAASTWHWSVAGPLAGLLVALHQRPHLVGGHGEAELVGHAPASAPAGRSPVRRRVRRGHRARRRPRADASPACGDGAAAVGVAGAAGGRRRRWRAGGWSGQARLLAGGRQRRWRTTADRGKAVRFITASSFGDHGTVKYDHGPVIIARDKASIFGPSVLLVLVADQRQGPRRQAVQLAPAGQRLLAAVGDPDFARAPARPACRSVRPSRRGRRSPAAARRRAGGRGPGPASSRRRTRSTGSAKRRVQRSARAPGGAITISPAKSAFFASVVAGASGPRSTPKSLVERVQPLERAVDDRWSGPSRPRAAGRSPAAPCRARRRRPGGCAPGTARPSAAACAISSASSRMAEHRQAEGRLGDEDVARAPARTAGRSGSRRRL